MVTNLLFQSISKENNSNSANIAQPRSSSRCATAKHNDEATIYKTLLTQKQLELENAYQKISKLESDLSAKNEIINWWNSKIKSGLVLQETKTLDMKEIYKLEKDLQYYKQVSDRHNAY